MKQPHRKNLRKHDGADANTTASPESRPGGAAEVDADATTKSNTPAEHSAQYRADTPADNAAADSVANDYNDNSDSHHYDLGETQRNADASGTHAPMHAHQSDRPATLTAIERQRLSQLARESAEHDFNLRRTREQRERSRRFGWFLLFAALAGVAFAITTTDFGQPLLKRVDAALPALQNETAAMVSAIRNEQQPAPPAGQTAPAAIESEVAATPLPLPEENTQPFDEPTAYPESAIPAAVTDEPDTALSSAAASTLSTTEEDEASATDRKLVERPDNRIALPIAELSLRTQPEFFKEIVQLYRSKLESTPTDTDASTALQQLQQRTLAELSAALEANEIAAARQLSEEIDKLFPEMAENTEYLALWARIARADKATGTEPASTPTTTDKATIVTRPAPPALPRPQIGSISVVAGRLDGDIFTRDNSGGVLMIQLAYRNFDNPPASTYNDTLIIRISAPGNPLVIAEENLTVPGDRGTRSVYVDTMLKEITANHYQIDFILNGRMLASRIVARMPSGY